jgi:hypothetical protein
MRDIYTPTRQPFLPLVARASEEASGSDADTGFLSYHEPGSRFLFIPHVLHIPQSRPALTIRRASVWHLARTAATSVLCLGFGDGHR